MNIIRQKDRDAVIQALRMGVVPRVGQYLIQVGRAPELKTLIADIETVAAGGTSFRMVIGDYGAGKTFFLNLVRAVAMEKKLVTTFADLNPDRRLHATGGQARSLYAELMRNLSTRSRPDGGAMTAIVERFVSIAQSDATNSGQNVEQVIRGKLAELTELVNGFDFATVIAQYWKGFESGNEQLKQDAIRWLRGEFTTKTEALAALGVRTIITDANAYDQLKLFARFVRLSGFTGLFITLDELVNLYKLSHTQARNSNYEQVLRILNDSMQGISEGLGFVMGGTPQFLTDGRRGLYSYEALRSRLAENAFAKNGLVDFTGPILRLASLTPEDFYVLLEKVRHVYALGHEDRYAVPDEAIHAFMNYCSEKLGNDYFRTPRTTITSFINLLAVLEQNPGVTWQQQVGEIDVERDLGGTVEFDPDDELATLSL